MAMPMVTSGAVAIDGKNALAFSSFGERSGQGLKPRSLLVGDRYFELDRLQLHYQGKQHDHKGFDFDGRVSSPRSTVPTISSEKFHQFVPLAARRPSTRYHLAKVIVDSFTSLIFGENRFPLIRVEGSKKDEDFLQTCARVGRLPMHMIRARTLGGAMGTVGVSWAFYKGKPRFEVHNGKNLHVHAWADRSLLIPKHVTEIYPFWRSQWDGSKKQFVKVYYWFRRDWLPDADIVFKDVLYEKDKDPVWDIDEELSNVHGDGITHFEWIQNLPNDDIDGLPDYDNLTGEFDAMDILMSVVMKGATLNLDPTLVLKMDPELLKRSGILKGSEHALVVGEGDASYLELSGSSIEAGTKLIESLRRTILETSQCVVPDPHEIAAQGVSSVAMKVVYAPMLSKADILREQYGTALERILNNMGEIARRSQNVRKPILNELGEPIPGPDGNPLIAAPPVILLPPRIEKGPTIDPVSQLPVVNPATGEPLPEKEIRVPRMPGEGGEVTLQWPPYFPPTPDDQAKVVANLSTATGGKAFMSVETAIDISSAAFGVQPQEEKDRLEEESKGAAASEASMFPDIGGPVKEVVPPEDSGMPEDENGPPDEGLNPEE